MISVFRTLIYTILTITITSFWCTGQSLKIIIKDESKSPLPGAKIQLTKLSDASDVFASTNANGYAEIKNVLDGLYVLKISFIGFETLEKNINVKQNQRDFEFKMTESSTALNEVTVAAKKPLITQEDDKMIIDPEPLANTSTNTLEVLESTPGLYVDQDGGIFLNSITAATIYINGREQKMSTQDITTLLRSLPPGSVQRIEVIRTPSTKYDAASSGGIINVVLKKGVKIGQFGSANIGMNQGVYGNRVAGFSFNGSGDNSTYYINANFNYNHRLEELNYSRIMGTDTILSQLAVTGQKSNQYFLGYGVNYDANEKLNFSYDGRINFNQRNSSAQNDNTIQAPGNELLSKSSNLTVGDGNFLSLQQDFGMNLKIDTTGSEWDTKFSFSYNNNHSLTDYDINYTLPFVASILGEGDNLQKRYFLNFQSDLTYEFPHKITLETGIKSSFQTYSSKADYFIDYNGTLVSDPVRTNAFRYRESISAAYLQISKTFWRYLVLKSGVRVEHTLMLGNQTIPSDTSFTVNRVDWFPYVYLSRKVFAIKGFELRAYAIYRKTISRPDYQNLNPYINFIDEFRYETGNPALKPQFTDNIELNVSFDDMPLFAVGQNYTSDIFAGVVYPDPDNENITVTTWDNLGKNRETYFRGIAGIPPGGKYFFALGAQYNLNEYQGFYENEPLNYTRGSWRFFTFHSLTLFGQTKITLSGFMMLKGIQNFYALDTFGQLNLGITQTFFDKKLTITISAKDILKTMLTQFELNQGSIHAYGDRYTDNRRIGVNIRYNFGLGKKEDKAGLMKYEQED